LPSSTEGWSERRETARQIRRFIVIGVLSVLTDWTVYSLLMRLGVTKYPAKGIGYVSGMIVGFIGNKLWTFESARRSAAEPFTYIVLYTTTLGVNMVVNGLLLDLLVLWLPYVWAWRAALFVATGVTTLLNFAGMKWITFRVGVRERRERVEAAARRQALVREEP
jgi:putative flippase GtrA